MKLITHTTRTRPLTYLSRLDLLLKELKQVRQTDGVFRLNDRPLEDAPKQFNHLPLYVHRKVSFHLFACITIKFVPEMNI